VPRVSAPEFPWLDPGPRRRAITKAQAERRAAMYRAELVDRAGLYSRLGYSNRRAVARLKANVAWDFELTGDGRPPGLTDRDIGEIVKTAYARRASR
jgi:hypothetical protein